MVATKRPKKAAERKLLGQPRSAADVCDEYESHRHQLILKSGKKAVLVPLFYPEAENLYRWRIELDCGCIEERLTYGDDPEKITAGHDRDPHGEKWLPPGQYQCLGKHRRAKPIRDIVDWCESAADEKKPWIDPNPRIVDFPADPVEPPEMWRDDPDVWAVIRNAEPCSSAFWRVKLSCGHYVDVVADVGWNPLDGASYVAPERLAEMQAEHEQMWAEQRGLSEVDKWHKRLLEEGWPQPAPFQQCDVCPRVQTLVAYERVGWLKPKPKPLAPPTPPPRRTLERRLEKLKQEAALIEEQLQSRPSGE